MTTETTEVTATEKALAAQGATQEQTDDGHNGKGNPVPVDKGLTKPEEKKPETKVEEKKTDEKKVDTATEEVTEPTQEEKDAWKKDYIKFEDEAGQSVVNLLNEAGVKPVEANAFFEEAIKSGDFTKIKWDLIEARLGKDKAALARIGITHHYNTIYKRNEDTRAKGYEVVGGEENWKKVATWVKSTEKADPKQKAVFDEIRKGIDAGGRLAEYAFADLRKMYEADSKNSGLGTNKIVQGDLQPARVEGALTKAAYLKEIKDAHARNATHAEINDIRARRTAGIQAGM